MIQTKTISMQLRCCALALLIHPLATLSAMGLETKTLSIATPQLPGAKGIPYFRPYGTSPDQLTLTAFFEGLTYLDESGSVQPLLAESWKMMSPLKWHFHLRSGVVFSNGASFDSEVFKKNFDIVRKNDNASFAIRTALEHIVSVTVVSPLEFIIETNRADPFLPNVLSSFFMVEPDYWMEVGPERFSENPIGTGPYEVIDWSPTKVTAEASTTAWRQPNIKNLEVYQMSSASSRVQGLMAGQIDIAFALDADSADLLRASGQRIYNRLEPGLVSLIFNLVEPSPLQDVRVRQALNFAVDRDRILEAILGDSQAVPTQFASRLAFGFDPEYTAYSYDPERAKSLLAEAGYSNGFSFTAEVVQGMSGYSQAIYQVAAQQLSDIGVNLEIRAVPVQRYSEILFQQKWQSLATNLDYASDPSMDALMPIRRHSCIGAIDSYCDEELMPLLLEALSTENLEKRKALTQQVIRRTSEQAPGILLWEKVRYDGYSPRLINFVYNVGSVPYHQFELETESADD